MIRRLTPTRAHRNQGIILTSVRFAFRVLHAKRDYTPSNGTVPRCIAAIVPGSNGGSKRD